MQHIESNIARRRSQRYYRLLSLFAIECRHRLDASPTAILPTPVSAESYAASNACMGRMSLTAVWLEQTAFLSLVSQLLLDTVDVRRVLRMDHTVKYAKKLQHWESKGKRKRLKDSQLILLIQNEVDQIVGRSLTRSENNAESEALLSRVCSRLEANQSTSAPGSVSVQSSSEKDKVIVVSDNANAVRSMIHRLSTPHVRFIVKQDPFHVIQRFSSKLRGVWAKCWPNSWRMQCLNSTES